MLRSARCFAFSALALILTMATPALAQQTKSLADGFAARGQREARAISYGDWEKVCFKPGGAKLVCRTTIAGRFETGQIAVRAYVIEREGDSTARMQLLLPVGLYVPAGVKLTIDGGAAYRLPFTWCLTNTCIAADVASPALLGELERGRNLAIEVIDTNMLEVKTSAPLQMFATVRAGAARSTFDQDIDE